MIDDDEDEQEEEEWEETGGDWTGKVDEDRGDSFCKNHVAMTGLGGNDGHTGGLRRKVGKEDEGGRVAESVRGKL